MKRARMDAEHNEAQRAQRRHAEYQTGVVLEIAKNFEEWTIMRGRGPRSNDPARPRAEAHLRAFLAALPPEHLGLLRGQLGESTPPESTEASDDAIRHQFADLLRQLSNE